MNTTGLLFVATGLFSMAGGFFNWEWYMNNRKARFMCSILTRNGARIFYMVVGAGFVVFGALMATGIIHDTSR